MPQACAATTIRDQTYPRRSSERKSTHRAASVPVGRQENTRLEPLRSKKPKLLLLNAADRPLSSLPAVVTARGHKRASSSCATPKVDCVASTSASMAESSTDANRRPRKRQKRSSSTPATPRASQLSSRLQPRRRLRSRFSSPSTDVEYVLPSQVSARLSRRVQSLIDIRTSDIYTHLADPDGREDLLNEPSVGPVVTSSQSGTVNSQSARRPRGRRKTTDLIDENAKKNLIKEWARLRESQGILPLSGINGTTCVGKTLVDTGSILSVQPDTIEPRGADYVKSQATTIINISQLQETVGDISLLRAFSTQVDSEKASLVGTDIPGKNLNHKDPALPSNSGPEQPIVPCSDTEIQSTWIFDSNLDEDSRTDKPTGALETALDPDSLQRIGSPPPLLSTSLSQGDSILDKHTELTKHSTNEQAESASLNDLPKGGCLYYHGDIHLDHDEDFYMFDIPEIFTLPWVPLSSRLYVPPSLAKLVSGMREQLVMEARARRRAEELYQAELSRRISAEKVAEDLRAELEGRRKTSQEN